jgi:hypothetical protein
MLISLSFIFLGRNMKPNEINGLTFKSDRLLEEFERFFGCAVKVLGAVRPVGIL